MIRFPLLALCMATTACGAPTPAVQNAASTSLSRGGGSEVRLRCGSETLRARLSGGRLLTEADSGESKVLVPVDDPRAKSGPAYSDGKLTLYKVPDAQAWTLAKGDAETAECRPETAAP